MARQIRRSPSIALLLVASSYVTLAYHTHPFSNTVETLILALSAVVLGKIIQQHETSTTLPSTTLSKSTTASHPSSASASSVLPSTGPYQPRPSPIHLTFLLGVLFAVGTFTRITFAVFGFPFGVMLLYLNAKASFWKGRSTYVGIYPNINECPSKTVCSLHLTKHHPYCDIRLRGLVAFIQACMPLAIGLGSMSAAAIFIDSIYFGKLVISRQPHGSPMTLVEIFSTSPLSWPSLSVQGSPTLTMWNNLQYNLDKDNLALHGLHPRFFHLLLNFPVLFGNLAWIGLSTIIRKVVAREWSSRSKLVTGTFISPVQSPLPQHVLRNTDDSRCVTLTCFSFLSLLMPITFSTHLLRSLWYGGTVFDAPPGSSLLDAIDLATSHFTLWKDFKTWSQILGRMPRRLVETRLG